MADTKPIMVDPDLHAMWKARAGAEGVTLRAYVERSVEDLERFVRLGVVDREDGLKHSYAPKGDGDRFAKVSPKDCTNRLRPGTYCRRCGSVHGKVS